MEYDSTPTEADVPPWDGLMRAFLALLRANGPGTSGEEVCNLFFGDAWFLDLIARRARQAADSGAVPKRNREDMEQEIALHFVHKASKRPDLQVDYEIVERHFGGWLWTIIDHLCIEVLRQRHMQHHAENLLMIDVAGTPRCDIDRRIDVGILITGLSPVSQTILSLFDHGFTRREIAEQIGEPYWKVCQIHRMAIAFLRERLND